jgi:hypothetical protein
LERGRGIGCAVKLHQIPKKLRFFSTPAKVDDEIAANRNIYNAKQKFKIVVLSGRLFFGVRLSFFGLKNPLAKAQNGFLRGAFKRTFEEQ